MKDEYRGVGEAMKIFLIFSLIAAIVIIVLFIKQSKKTEADVVTYDLIVSIKVAPAPNILQHPKIKQVAAWEVYGEGVFKGKSVITKEEMQSLLIKELCLSKEDVLVVNMREGNKKEVPIKEED